MPTNNKSINPKPDALELLGMGLAAMTHLFTSKGMPGYRAKQLLHAIYRQRVATLEAVSTFPKSLIQECKDAGIHLGVPRIDKRFVSIDGTVRYLIAFADDNSVETVWMPEGDDGESGDGSEAGDEETGKDHRTHRRATICVSSQVGCAVGCKFCLTAQLGLQRNLSVGEIVGQVLCVLNDHKVDISRQRINLVFMGQGEPFHNYDNFMSAVRLLVEGVGITASRMTVSTSGIVPRISDLGGEAVRPKLAISLNAPTDALRTRIMPINRKWDIADILKAARHFPLRRKEKITLEYVLLGGTTDTTEQARSLTKLVAPLRDRCKVNLIAWNPGPGTEFHTPDPRAVRTFQEMLVSQNIPAYIRKPRGRDIYAACGQLKRTME